MTQRLCILGCGAMGAIYAARFAQAGHEVWAVDPWAAHVAAINDAGLQVEGPGAPLTARVQARTDLAEVPPCDLYIVATKAAGVAPAAQAIATHGAAEAPVLTIQNGLGAYDRIAAHLSGTRVILGVAEGFGAQITAPGQIRHAAMKQIRLGEPAGGVTARLQAQEALWRGAGFDTSAYGDITQLIWEKFLCNVTLSAPCAVFDVTVGELMAHPDHWQIALGCMHEAYAVGRAQSVNFTFDDPEAYVTAFATRVAAARPSLAQDFRAGKRGEIDAINGAVPPLAEALGLPSPYNRTLSAVIRAREAQF